MGSAARGLPGPGRGACVRKAASCFRGCVPQCAIGCIRKLGFATMATILLVYNPCSSSTQEEEERTGNQ